MLGTVVYFGGEEPDMVPFLLELKYYKCVELGNIVSFMKQTDGAQLHILNRLFCLLCGEQVGRRTEWKEGDQEGGCGSS